MHSRLVELLVSSEVALIPSHDMYLKIQREARRRNISIFIEQDAQIHGLSDAGTPVYIYGADMVSQGPHPRFCLIVNTSCPEGYTVFHNDNEARDFIAAEVVD